MEECPQAETTFEKLLEPSVRKNLLQFLETNKPWNTTLLQLIELLGIDVIRQLVPEHFISDEKMRALSDYMKLEVVPTLDKDSKKLVQLTKNSRHIVDDILEEVALRKEAEYTGRMYLRDPKFKVSLASVASSSKRSEIEKGMELKDGELDAVKEFRNEVLEDGEDEFVMPFPHAPPPTPTPLEETADGTEEVEGEGKNARNSHNSIQSHHSGKRTSANSATKEDEHESTENGRRKSSNGSQQKRRPTNASAD